MGNKAFRDKVRFYEDNKNKVHHLDYEERIEVDLDYAICLFEIGKYHKYLSLVDNLIEVVIIDNIFTYNGINIYNDLLFKKAACLYNTGQYLKSEEILKTIVKMDPENNLARSLYGRCKRKQGRDWYEGAKAMAILMLFSGVILSIAELLLIRPFLYEHLNTFKSLKIICFVLGILSLLLNELYLSYVIGREIGYKFDLQSLKERFGLNK